MRNAVLCALLSISVVFPIHAQKAAWRQATSSELASVLPSRAQVVNEHIETEMRTASGIVNGKGQFIAGVVLLTAGYSADGKYSHYLLAQVPTRMEGVLLPPGNYLIGWTRTKAGDALDVHFNEAASGKLVGSARAKRIPGRGAVESIQIWTPQSGSRIQIGRFGIDYKLVKERPEP